jgi:glucose/arabinose dehydrogenase
MAGRTAITAKTSIRGFSRSDPTSSPKPFLPITRSHVAPLGLAFYTGTNLPEAYRGGAFVGEHGSWNRPNLNGYKVAFVPFKDGKPDGVAQDVVTGFLNGDNQARGRPVGVAVDKAGALLIADDVGNTVWRVTSAGG